MKAACAQSWVFGPHFPSTDSVNEKWTLKVELESKCKHQTKLKP